MPAYARSSGSSRGLNQIIGPTGMTLMLIIAIISTCSCRESADITPATSNQNASSVVQAAAPKLPAAPCDNPYYPPASSAVLNYKITNRGTTLPSLTYSERRGNLTLGSFTDHREFSDGIKTDAQWSCTPDGLVSSEYAIPAVVRLTSAYKFDSVRAAHPAIPVADKWAPGYEWTTTYQVSGSQIEGGSQSQGKVSGTIEVKSQIVSSEKVTVPAGSYDCWLVDSTIRAPLKIEASSGAFRPALMSIRVSAWYAKGVGLVRAAYSGDIGTGQEELTSIK